MKFVAFLMPDMAWDGYDWLYNLIEDQHSDYYNFFLVEARNAEKARELALHEFWEKDVREYGVESLVHIVYESFCELELEDEELLQYLGEKDGQAVLKLYEKYGWESFHDNKIDFDDTLTKEEREIFYSLDIENTEKLYKERKRYEILLARIDKEIKQKEVKQKKIK